MSGQIPEAVLSERLRDSIGKRRVKTAIFLTYQFEPAFFESEILPLLFEQTFSHFPALRLVQLEEALVNNGGEIAVYYDRRALVASANSARLNYLRNGLSRRTGVFHPKVILLLLENKEENPKTGEITDRDSLLVMVSSANLTRAGWWENVEVAHVDEINDGERCSYRSDLLNLIRLVKRESRAEEEHPALESIRAFILRLSYNETSKWDNRWRTRLFTGREDVPDFLAGFIPSGEFNLEVISPFFDRGDSVGTLERLIESTQPKLTRIFLPEDHEASAQCSKQYFLAARGLKHVQWGRLPKDILRFSSSGKDNQPIRFVHAKTYRFWNQEREIFFVGSVNLTQSAHSNSGSGNLEAAFLVEPLREEDAPAPRWWLEPLPQEYKPAFKERNSEDLLSKEEVPPCTLRYNWMSEELSYYWEEGGRQKPQRAVISSDKVTIFEISPIIFGAWTQLPRQSAEKLQNVLRSTSYVDIAVEGITPVRILVQEEGMRKKPSLLFSLTVEEILEYWSLLSPEQRETFLLAHIPVLAIGTEMGFINLPLPKMETMFDRFAGIFHAFGRIEKHIDESLKDGRKDVAKYCLFSTRYDSLPSLIDKVIAGENGDRVNRYITLLCARQLLENVTEQHPEFIEEMQDECRQVLEQIKVVDQIKGGFTFDSPEYREKFMAWFERMFFKRFVRMPAEEPE
jgi:hypothetical protein